MVDTLRGGVVASIPVRTRPYALAVTPDATGSEVWVPNHDAASISIINTATNTVTTTLPVAPNPHWVAFSPDGNLAYTANHESNLITVLDVAAHSAGAWFEHGSNLCPGIRGFSECLKSMTCGDGDLRVQDHRSAAERGPSTEKPVPLRRAHGGSRRLTGWWQFLALSGIWR